MPQPLHYPRLHAPTGWTRAQHLTQVRYTPPGEPPQGTPSAAIYVSPLIARHPQLPSPERLLAHAIETERDAHLTLTDFREPAQVTSESGLSGISVQIGCTVHETGAAERRVYVMYSDALCYYGFTYIASATAFEQHLAVFWALCRSVQPFQGRAVSQAEQAAKIIGQYED